MPLEPQDQLAVQVAPPAPQVPPASPETQVLQEQLASPETQDPQEPPVWDPQVPRVPPDHKVPAETASLVPPDP